MKKIFINPTVKFNAVESSAIIAESQENTGSETGKKVEDGGAARQMHQTISAAPSSDGLDL